MQEATLPVFKGCVFKIVSCSITLCKKLETKISPKVQKDFCM